MLLGSILLAVTKVDEPPQAPVILGRSAFHAWAQTVPHMTQCTGPVLAHRVIALSSRRTAEVEGTADPYSRWRDVGAEDSP